MKPLSGRPAESRKPLTRFCGITASESGLLPLKTAIVRPVLDEKGKPSLELLREGPVTREQLDVYKRQVTAGALSGFSRSEDHTGLRSDFFVVVDVWGVPSQVLLLESSDVYKRQARGLHILFGARGAPGCPGWCCSVHGPDAALP